MYKDLNRFTLNGITLKEASTITLENMKKKLIIITIFTFIHIKIIIINYNINNNNFNINKCKII